MKKLLPILLMIWPYLVVLIFSLENEHLYLLLLLLYVLLSFFLMIFSVINAWTYSGEEAARELAAFNLLIKMVHIPFYLVVFIIGIGVLFASVVPALIFVTPIFLVILIVVDTLLLWTSSMYGVSALVKARKGGRVTTCFAVVNSILHFVFVADVISAIVVFFKIRKRNS